MAAELRVLVTPGVMKPDAALMEYLPNPALLLAADRHIVAADKFVRDGLWRGILLPRVPVVRGLEGQRIGIYGDGAIGAKIAARCAAFETKLPITAARRSPV